MVPLLQSPQVQCHQQCENLYSEQNLQLSSTNHPIQMLAQSDSYNRLISKQQLEQSYKLFRKLLTSSVNKSYLQNHVTDQQILSEPPTSNPLHKVVSLDCLRTRSTNFTPQEKKKLECVLNYFVRIHQIEYKQGLNEIAALFVLWTRIGVPLSDCYKMFQRFFIKFSLNFYYDKDFTGLEMFFRMISLVLRYHCPSLSRYLAVYDIQPQIYALSWLMTLFSSKLSMKMTYLLWSYLIAENDKYLLFFIVVGIIVHKKNDIIQTKNSSIFKIVTDMIFKSQQEMEEVIKISLVLRKNTPISLMMFFEEKQLFDRLESYKQSAELLEHITKLNVLVILPKELYSARSHNPKNCHKPSCPLCIHNKTIKLDEQIINTPWLYKFVQISNDIKKISKKIQFVIIDLRKQKNKLNSVNEVHQVDITQPFEQIQTNFLNQYLEQMSLKHFTILLTGFTFEDTTFSDKEEFACAKKFLHVLNSYSFPSLGILEGGYTALSIYEQEYRIKEKIEEESIDRTNQLNPLKEGDKSEILQNVLLEGTHQMILPLSLLFQIAQLKYKDRVKLFYGSQKLIVLVTQCFLIVLQDKQGLVAFMSYLQHNCSIVPYFYSSFSNVSCHVLKVLPIEKVTKLKAVTYSQNSLIVRFSSEVQEEKERRRTIEIRLESQKRDSIELSMFLVEEFKQLLSIKYGEMMSALQVVNRQKGQQKKGVTTKEKQKKLILTMKDSHQVKEISISIQANFKSIMKHKYITQKQKQSS